MDYITAFRGPLDTSSGLSYWIFGGLQIRPALLPYWQYSFGDKQHLAMRQLYIYIIRAQQS